MFSRHLGRWNWQRVRASQKWFRGKGLRVKIAEGRGGGRNHPLPSPLPFSFNYFQDGGRDQCTFFQCTWKNACSAGWKQVCCQVSFLYYALILASHWLVVSEKEYLKCAATFGKLWFVFIFILSNHILPPDTSPKWRRARKKREAYESYILFNCTLSCLNSRPGSWDTPLCARTVLQLKEQSGCPIIGWLSTLDFFLDYLVV